MARLSYLALALLMVAFGGCTGDTAGGDDTAGRTGTAGTTSTDSTGDTDGGGDDTPEASALPIEILGPAGTVVGPAFPYEVGFAFFEAAFVNGLPDAMRQAYSWWIAQVAVNPGRGQTTGDRPLNWRDVLTVADSAGAGPWTLTYLHLVGSLEESQGALADDFGTDRGPVRLLAVPLRRVAGPVRAALMRRFLTREAAFLAGGGALTSEHHVLLGNA